MYLQVREFQPKMVAIRDSSKVEELKEAIKDVPTQPEILVGDEGAIEVARHSEVDAVVTGIVGECSGRALSPHPDGCRCRQHTWELHSHERPCFCRSGYDWAPSRLRTTQKVDAVVTGIVAVTGHKVVVTHLLQIPFTMQALYMGL